MAIVEEPCKNLKGILYAERTMLNVAFKHRRYVLSKRQSTDVDLETAQREFLSDNLSQWAEGFRLTYCSYVCPKRALCDTFKDKLSKWDKYDELHR